MADTTIKTKTKLPTTEDILNDLKQKYHREREIPEGWVTAEMAVPMINIGKKAILNKLNGLVKEGTWESKTILVDGHPTKIFRPMPQ